MMLISLGVVGTRVCTIYLLRLGVQARLVANEDCGLGMLTDSSCTKYSSTGDRISSRQW